MGRRVRNLFRVLTGLVIIAITSATTAAYAMPAPPPPDGFPPPGPITGAPDAVLAAGTSYAQEIGWMLSGAALVLLAVAAVCVTVLFARRRRIGQLQPL